MDLINDIDICYHHLGAAPPKLFFFYNIVLIDIFCNYEPISTKFLEISVFSGK